ncbi:disease resistance protein At4g27190-like [Amaranthus tricolor]|uniref:disease resistance protein At4g27190-like n=1 Tax=Amaranthus tricolor TaxID=29722 RepID=UPI0025904385|nr:disease resistance protein At4g27190-like [Amaranthus tricolor]
MAREMSTLLLGATAAGTAIQPLAIWEGIKQGKEILEFIGELPNWINYNQTLEEHLANLKKKTVSLQSVEADIVKELENTEHQSGRKRKREVSHWLSCVKRKFDDVQKVEDNFNTVSYIPRFLFRAWIGSCIGNEIQEVNELLQQASFPTGLLLDARDSGEILVTNTLNGEVAARKLDEVWEQILSPIALRIGVHGPEGIGKTAILAEVYNRLCPFCRVYYVNVPQDCSVYRLQECIAVEMKVILPQAENRRAGRILNVLKKMQEFVLILDGLSQEFCLTDVGIPMEGNKGKLILASRSLDVCRKMLCQATVSLEPMSMEDSKILFMEKLASNAPLSEEIRSVAADIIRKCNGIPSRIIDMAVQLRGVADVHDWRCTLSEM